MNNINNEATIVDVDTKIWARAYECGEDIGCVLRCNFELERCINNLINTAMKGNTKRLIDSNLSTRINVLEALGLNSNFISAIREVNKIRNQFAHQFENLTEEQISRLFKKVKMVLPKIKNGFICNLFGVEKKFDEFNIREKYLILVVSITGFIAAHAAKI